MIDTNFILFTFDIQVDVTRHINMMPLKINSTSLTILISIEALQGYTVLVKDE